MHCPICHSMVFVDTDHDVRHSSFLLNMTFPLLYIANAEQVDPNHTILLRIHIGLSKAFDKGAAYKTVS